MRSRTLALWLAGAVPWIAYVFTCSAHAYWLDSGEFVAAAVALDIAHPPGHPLTQLYGKLWSLVPFGSLPFRVALGQGFATALASVLVCRATAHVLRRLEVPDAVRWPSGLLAAWTSAFTYGLWFQAVRPEVYALQTLCTAVVLERVTSFLPGSEGAGRPARAAGPAGFALGLGLANHHFTALLVVPALLVPACVLVRRARLRTVLGAGLLGALALATYAYLPLRAARPLPANLGQPDDFSRFLWVVSARVYTQGTGNRDGFSLGERLWDVLVLLVESFGALPLLAAGVGLYALLRDGRSRLHGLFFALLIGPNLVARAWLGPVRSNPDVLGYFGSSILAIGVLAACLPAVLLARLASLPHTGWLARAGILLPALALLGVPATWKRASLADFVATDSLDERRVRAQPPRAVLVETMPQTVFRHWELAAVERVRPDLAQLPIPFLTHPGKAEAIVRREPALAGVVAAYLRDDRLQCDSLRALARARPTRLELDPRVPPACYPDLRLELLVHRVVSAGAGQSGEHGGRLSAQYAALYAELGGGLSELETRRQLLAVHYLNAAYFAALGRLERAQGEIARAARLAPSDRNVQALAAALAGGEGPIAIGPYLDL